MALNFLSRRVYKLFSALFFVLSLFWSVNSYARRTVDDDKVFFVIANVENTVAHEMAHVIIDEFQVPVLGNMELAADQLGLLLFSSLMINVDKFPQGKMEIMRAIYDEVRLEWGSKKDTDKRDYTSIHPFEPQRFYDIACLVYGSDPVALEEIREFVGIPYSRSFYCRDEYEVTQQSVSWVISHLGRKTAYDSAEKKITVVYEQAESDLSEELKKWLQTSAIIDSIAQRAEELFEFPRPITISVADCQQPNSMWLSGKGEVVLCYQLLERYLYLARFRDSAPEDILGQDEWSAFCMHESIANHYSGYCNAVVTPDQRLTE
ncbi:MAG: hypothetical protein KDI30_03375 [Pseudomonadales bacterium]|nr:hypothetical protein [Pseudomonadales bacterium]